MINTMFAKPVLARSLVLLSFTTFDCSHAPQCKRRSGLCDLSAIYLSDTALSGVV